MAAILKLLQAKPELALFLSLVAGQFIGLTAGPHAVDALRERGAIPPTRSAMSCTPVAGPVVVAVLHAWNN